MIPTLTKSSRWEWPTDFKANVASAAIKPISFDWSKQAPSGKRIIFVDIQKTVVDANRPRSVRSAKSSIEAKFREYADKWYAETMRDSSISRMTSNVNYLNVIKLGPDVVPLILKELQSDPAPWFLALRVLTENFEVGIEHAGNFEKIAEAWINWGKARGLI